MPSVWLLAALLPLSLSLVCPTFTCANLEAGVCAVKDTEETAKLSASPCPTGQFCSGQRLYEDWWWNSGTPLGSSYQCVSEATHTHTSLLDKEPYAQWPCPVFESNKFLASGSHPKDCQSDDDCLLADGSHSSCLCGFRGSGNLNSTFGVCQPHQSDPIFINNWAACNSERLVENRDVGFYYKVIWETYAVVHASSLSCAQSIIWEFALLQASYAVETAETLTAALVWLSLS